MIIDIGTYIKNKFSIQYCAVIENPKREENKRSEVKNKNNVE